MPHGHPGPQEPIARPGPHAAELGLLLEELRLARAGSRLVTLSGEPWIGKSRLARLLSWEAEHRGWVVAWGRPPWDGAPRPFHSLVDALDDWLAAADPAALRRLGEVRIRTLARLFPALGGAGTDGGGGVDVHATARAVRALLELMAGDDGLLLVLDDAHRAGPEMIELAEYLMHHPPAAPVLTVLVHRRGPTALALSGLTAGVGAVRPVELRPLDRAHAESLLPPGIGPLRRELVLRDAEGVPGLLRALAAAESPEPEQPAHSTRELACGAPPWRAGVPGLDLRTLSPLGRRTMATAAVMGDPFSVTALAAGPDTGEALRAVEELHGEGIVRPDTRAGWFRFARPVVRALMWHAYGPERGVGPVPAGGDRPEAVTALLETSSTLTSREAALLEESARAMVFEQPARSARSARRVAQWPDAPVSARLLLCQALVLSGRLPEAVGEYARLWPLQERFGGPAGPWAEAAVWRARALRLLGAGAQARRALRSGPAEERAVLHVAHAELASLLLESGRPMRGAALAVARRAMRSVPRGDVAAHGHALALLAAARAVNGDVVLAREVAFEADLLLSGLGRTRSAPVLEAWRRLGEAAAAGGDAERALRCFHKGFDLALHHGQRHLLGPMALGLARASLDLGDPASAYTHAHFAAAEFEQFPSSPFNQVARELRKSAEYAGSDNQKALSSSILSSREREVAFLIGPGFTNQQIATRLNLSVKTVETYMGRIFKKMGASSRAQVAVIVSGAPVPGAAS